MSKSIRELFGLNAVAIQDCTKIYPVADPTLEVINSDQAIGIEVEVENHKLNKHPNPHVWVLKGDGSLRNSGVEYVTVPIAAKFGPAALQDLLSQSLAQSCCFSPRTSIHVHVDMQSWDSTQVMDVVLMYTLLENLFYKFTGRGRIKNIYCVPIFDTSLLKGLAARGRIDVATEVWSKYTGLNIIRLRDLGTIEFRHMHGTFDVKKISIWIRLIVKLCDYVLKVGTEYIRKLCQGGLYSINYADLLRDIFDTDAQYMKYESHDDVRKGVDGVKLSFTSNKNIDVFRQIPSEKRGAYFNKLGS